MLGQAGPRGPEPSSSFERIEGVVVKGPVVLAEGVEDEIRVVRDAGELELGVRDLQSVEMLLELAIEAERLIAVADDLADEEA